MVVHKNSKTKGWSDMSTYVYIKKSNDESKSVLNQIALINQYEVDELFIEEDKSVKELERLITKLADKDVLVLDNLAVIELSRYDMSNFFQLLKDRSIRSIANECNVSIGTVHKYVNDHQ